MPNLFRALQSQKTEQAERLRKACLEEVCVKICANIVMMALKDHVTMIFHAAFPYRVPNHIRLLKAYSEL